MTVDLATTTVTRPIEQVAAEGWACALAYAAIRSFDVPDDNRCSDCGQSLSDCNCEGPR